MNVEQFTSTEIRILKALATYRFVIAAQLLRLGVTSNRAHLYGRLGTLKRRRPAAVGRIEFGVRPGVGQLPGMYHLTRRGAERLAQQLCVEAVSYPRSVQPFFNDQAHRIATVDVHIALGQWAAANGATVDRFETYFDHGAGSGRLGPRTRVAVVGGKALDPDAVGIFTTADGTARLVAVEVCKGRRTQRVVDQLAAYLPALEQKAIGAAFGYPRGARVLVVFEDGAALRLVQRQLAARPEFEPGAPFYLGTLDGVQADFRGAWQGLDGQARGLF